MNRIGLIALAAIAGLILTAPVRAGLLPVSHTVTPEAGQFRWTYAIVLPTDVQLRTGDYFTIYDFAGYQTGSNAQPTDWAFSTANVGPVPPGVLPPDDPALPNLTWRYTGANVNGSAGLGNFWAVSLYSAETTSYFTARTHRSTDGRPDSNITPSVVPVPSAVDTPEPATLALAALGLPLVGLLRRRNRNISRGTVNA